MRFVHVVKCSPDSPVLLIVDNHDSRYDATMREYAQLHGVILLALPPNSTNTLQPLDDDVFGSFKHESHLLVDQAALEGIDVNRLNLVEIISPAWVNAVKIDNIASAFEHTGIWPVNRNAVMSRLLEHPVPEATTSSSSSKPEDNKQELPLPDGQLHVPNMMDIPDDLRDTLIVPDVPTDTKDKGFAKILTALDLKTEVTERQKRSKAKHKKQSSAAGDSQHSSSAMADDVSNSVPASEPETKSESQTVHKPRKKRPRSPEPALSSDEVPNKRLRTRKPLPELKLLEDGEDAQQWLDDKKKAALDLNPGLLAVVCMHCSLCMC